MASTEGQRDRGFVYIIEIDFYNINILMYNKNINKWMNHAWCGMQISGIKHDGSVGIGMTCQSLMWPLLLWRMAIGIARDDAELWIDACCAVCKWKHDAVSTSGLNTAVSNVQSEPCTTLNHTVPRPEMPEHSSPVLRLRIRGRSLNSIDCTVAL